MKKTDVTTQMVHDYFDGATTTVDSAMVQRLLIDTIEELMACAKTVNDLVDGGLISQSLLRDHGIEMPVDCAVDYFSKYVQERRSTAGENEE